MKKFLIGLLIVGLGIAMSKAITAYLLKDEEIKTCEKRNQTLVQEAEKEVENFLWAKERFREQAMADGCYTAIHLLCRDFSNKKKQTQCVNEMSGVCTRLDE